VADTDHVKGMNSSRSNYLNREIMVDKSGKNRKNYKQNRKKLSHSPHMTQYPPLKFYGCLE